MCRNTLKLVDLAPRANPLNLIRRLLEEHKRASFHHQVADASSSGNIDSNVSAHRWQQALTHARTMARQQLQQKQDLYSRWPTVGELKQYRKKQSEQYSKAEAGSPKQGDEAATPDVFDWSRVDSLSFSYDQVDDDQQSPMLHEATPETTTDEEWEGGNIENHHATLWGKSY